MTNAAMAGTFLGSIVISFFIELRDDTYEHSRRMAHGNSRL